MLLQELLIMTESFLLQEKKIKEQEDYCRDAYGNAAFNNATPPLVNGTTGNFCGILFLNMEYYCFFLSYLELHIQLFRSEIKSNYFLQDRNFARHFLMDFTVGHLHPRIHLPLNLVQFILRDFWRYVGEWMIKFL